MVTLIIGNFQPKTGRAGVAIKTARSIDDEKILDNAEDAMLFPKNVD
jgi:hypothetical protein